MKVQSPRCLALLASVVALACSASGDVSPIQVGTDGTGGGNGLPGTGGTTVITIGDAGYNQPFSAHIEQNHVRVKIVTLACAGDCADVEAVASGGQGPYRFAWEDGSTNPGRHVCPSASSQYSVQVTDQGILSGEFKRPPETLEVPLTADVLTCTPPPVDAGHGPPPVRDGGTPPVLCDQSPAPPFQMMKKVLNETTPAIPPLPGYTSDTGSTAVVVARATLYVNIGSCTELLLAADAAGTQPVGWDNFLIVEYRDAPGGPVNSRWYYGAGSVSYSGQLLPTPLAPTVSGLAFGIPNPVPFGYDPLAIDLMKQVPAGKTTFEVTLYVVDTGGFASTTDIWGIPR